MVECGLIGSSFCKVYLSSQSSHHLCIPPAFVRKFNGNFVKDVTLGDTSGNLWHMETEKNENEVFLKLGWEKFAEDHSLGYGDFLEFIYSGNSVFKVKIFGKHGCIKNQGLSKRDSYKELRVIPKPIELEGGPNEGQTSQKTISKSKRKVKGSSDATQRIRRRTTTLCISEVEPNEGQTRPIPIPASKPKAKGSCDATQRKLRNTTLSICEPSSEEDSSEFPMTRNPHFIGSVNPKLRYNLYIPRDVLKKNCFMSGKLFVFDTQDGKKWPVSIFIRVDDRYSFGGGWMKFCKGNSLTPQDKCRFEFIYNKNGTLRKKVLVRIHRATK